MKKSTETSKEPSSYYASLTQRKAKSHKSFDNFMMTQTPQTPEELRQYMDFLKVHYKVEDYDQFLKGSPVLKYSRMQIRDMKQKYPKNRDIRMASRTLRSVTISRITKKSLFILGISLLCIAVLAGLLWFYNKHPKLYVVDTVLDKISHFFTLLFLFLF